MYERLVEIFGFVTNGVWLQINPHFRLIEVDHYDEDPSWLNSHVMCAALYAAAHWPSRQYMFQLQKNAARGAAQNNTTQTVLERDDDSDTPDGDRVPRNDY